jgi:hypothetical protein
MHDRTHLSPPSIDEKKVWYRQFWPWFLIAIPLTSVTYSLSAVYLFAQNSVHLVEEDYYKKGKAINLDRGRLNLAKALSISGVLYLHETVSFQLKKGELTQFPAIKIQFVHPTLPKFDKNYVLSSDAQGRYRFSSPLELNNAVAWYVKIQPVVGDWALQGNLKTTESELRL